MIYSDKGNLENLEPIDFISTLFSDNITDFKEVESKRCIPIDLHENVFNDPYDFLKIVENLDLDDETNPEVATSKFIGKILSTLNAKKYPKTACI